jgi:hypothetical protein
MILRLTFWRRLGLVVLLSMIIVGAKLVWFSPWNQQVAERVAMETLDHYAHDHLFDSSKIGHPNSISGNDKEGYVFRWRVATEDRVGYTDLTITVSELDDDLLFEGVALDCRAGKIKETREYKFEYLCLK